MGMTLDELAVAIARLPALPAIERARRARELSGVAKTVLSEVGDAAVVEATASASWADVARALGVGEASINKAVSRYRKRAREASP